MGRRATIASGNVWYEARMKAAKYNEKLTSRFGAADAAGMSEDAIKSTELGLEKQMPVDKAVILADLYNAPHLLNYYCLHECPIGKSRPISDEVPSIEKVTIKLIKSLRTSKLQEVLDKLVDVAESGAESREDEEDLKDVVEYLEGVAKSISELCNISRKLTGGGPRWKKKNHCSAS